MILKRIVQFSLFFCSVNTGIIGANTADIETIIEGADLGDKLILSGQGNLLYEYVRVDSLGIKAQEDDKLFIAKLSEKETAVIRNSERIKLNITFSDNKILCDEISWNKLPTGRWFVQEWFWAYNGEKMDLLRLDGLADNGLIMPIGSIRTNNDIPLHRYDPRYYGLNIFGTPVATFLQGSLNDKIVSNLEIIGEENIEGFKCNVVRGNINDTNETITAWLAPDLLYRPIRIEHTSLSQTIEISNHFKVHSEGVWFPDQIVKKKYYFDSNTGKKMLYIRETLTIDNDFKINIDIPPGVFEIEFPIGLSIYDYRMGKSIEVK